MGINVYFSKLQVIRKLYVGGFDNLTYTNDYKSQITSQEH